MVLRPAGLTRTGTLFPDTTLFPSLDPVDTEGMQAFQAKQERARIGFNRSDAHCAIEEAPVDVGGEQGRITAAYFDQALRLPVAQERKQRARIDRKSVV